MLQCIQLKICVQEAERYSKLRSDLQAVPLLDADVEYWTDGSCYHVDDKLSAGYAVVRPQGVEFVVENAEVIPQPASAQLAEIVELTEACLCTQDRHQFFWSHMKWSRKIKLHSHLDKQLWMDRGATLIYGV